MNLATRIKERVLFTCLIAAVIILSSCVQASTTVTPAQVEQPVLTTEPVSAPPPANPPAVKTEALTTLSTGAPPALTEAPAIKALPPEPQDIELQAEDGQSLQGRYYPAAIAPAPLVVLMHWAPGDQNEWNAIAPWLQNRGQVNSSPGKPWLDASWFPPMLEGQTFAVFTFTFRNCEGGCKSFTRDAWLLDAHSAIRTASRLEGVDPSRIVAVGASIGADGAADSCSWLNAQSPNSCLGSFSLSPGGYLTIPYQDAVSALGLELPPKPAWCLYAEGDAESRQACEAASGDNYRSIKYTGEDHGMYILQPDVDPSALQLMLDFLKLALGL